MIDPAAALAQGAMIASMLPRWRAFRAALEDPRRAQEEVLRRIIAANARTAFLRDHRVGPDASPDLFRARVPPRTYDELEPFVARAAAGEPAVLTAAPVHLFQPSSGSAAASKLVPYPAPLAAEFRRALSPWIADLYLRAPALLAGPAYWSVSPAGAGERRTAGGIRIGFEDDAEYLGGLGRRIFERTLAVPSALRHARDLETWRERTLLHLLLARELRLLSVWNPSFLALLLAPLRSGFDALVRRVDEGTPARAVGDAVLPAIPKDPARARELSRGGPDPRRIWPRLRLVSAWVDGPAAADAARLETLLPGVALRPKGLVATEAIVSIPFGGQRPVAIRSHWVELDLGPRGLVPVHRLREGDEGAVVVTTGGGLYRYRLQDRVAVSAFLRRTPCITFLGKEDLVLDRFGEKLHETFVARIIAALRRELSLGDGLAFLAPDDPAAPKERPGYTLHLAAPSAPPGLAARLEALLEENFHYAHCVRLGQLAPARVFVVEPDGLSAFFAACVASGRPPGDVKPSPVQREGGWSRRLPGRYA